MEFKEIYLQTIDSTQTYAKEQFKILDNNIIYCIVADDQTSGKGRFNRAFICEKLKNLYITFAFTLDDKFKSLSSISHIMALSLIDTLIAYDVKANIKWPNDIYLNNKKLSGILTEIIKHNDLYNVFLGIGINVNSEEEFLKNIKNATSLKKELNKKFDRKGLLEKLKINFLKNLNIFKEKGFSPFNKYFENLLLYKDKEIVLSDGKNRYFGKIHSVTNEGLLNLYLKDKSIKTFACGEIIQT